MPDQPPARKGPIAGCVHVVARPGGAEEMLGLLTRMADEAVKDDGTEIWAVHRLAEGVEEFFIYECFRDDDSFARHQGNEALNRLGKELAEITERLVPLAGRLFCGPHPLA